MFRPDSRIIPKALARPGGHHLTTSKPPAALHDQTNAHSKYDNLHLTVQHLFRKKEKDLCRLDDEQVYCGTAELVEILKTLR